MTITPTYKFPSGYMGGHLPLATASLLSFLLTYLLTLLRFVRTNGSPLLLSRALLPSRTRTASAQVPRAIACRLESRLTRPCARRSHRSVRPP